MTVGTEAGLGRGDIVLDGGPSSPHGKGHSSLTTFRPISIVANGRPSQQLLSSCFRRLDALRDTQTTVSKHWK